LWSDLRACLHLATDRHRARARRAAQRCSGASAPDCAAPTIVRGAAHSQACLFNAEAYAAAAHQDAKQRDLCREQLLSALATAAAALASKAISQRVSLRDKTRVRMNKALELLAASGVPQAEGRKVEV
jgi:hypothetical protein